MLLKASLAPRKLGTESGLRLTTFRWNWFDSVILSNHKMIPRIITGGMASECNVPKLGSGYCALRWLLGCPWLVGFHLYLVARLLHQPASRPVSQPASQRVKYNPIAQTIYHASPKYRLAN